MHVVWYVQHTGCCIGEVEGLEPEDLPRFGGAGLGWREEGDVTMSMKIINFLFFGS